MEQHLTFTSKINFKKNLKINTMTQFKTHNGFTKSFDGLLHELFSEMPATIGKTMREDVFSFPPVNITEKTDSYQLDVAAPG